MLDSEDSSEDMDYSSKGSGLKVEVKVILEAHLRTEISCMGGHIVFNPVILGLRIQRVVIPGIQFNDPKLNFESATDILLLLLGVSWKGLVSSATGLHCQNQRDISIWNLYWFQQSYFT